MSDQDVRAAFSPKIQAHGRVFILQLYTVIRTSRIHDPSNNAILLATEHLKDTINGLWAALGSVRFQFVEEIPYLNDVRIRVDSSMLAQTDELRQVFHAREMGGVVFSRPVDTIALRDFLVALGKPVESEEGSGAAREALEKMKFLAAELIGARHFADSVDQEIKIDRKTFALQTYAKTVIAARECVTAVREGRDPMAVKPNVMRTMQDLVDIATERVNFLLRVSAIKSKEDYAANHAANTCVLAVVIGKSLGIERVPLVELATSALTADLGWALLPPERLNRETVLSPQEVVEMRRDMQAKIHRIVSSGVLSSASITRGVVAFEHHLPYSDERSGHILQANAFSRIVAVADAYDALTTARPWREGYPADEALKLMLAEAGKRFDPLVLKVLVNLLGLYPLGSAVELDSGEIAVVYHNSNDPKLFTKPWVKIITDTAGQKIKKTLIRNLAETPGSGGNIRRIVHGIGDTGHVLAT